MKAILIKYTPNPGREAEEVPGYLVPDTEGLFGIDMRYEGDIEMIPPQPNGWVITHLPTGARVHFADYTDARSQWDAARIAKRFYNEYKTRGWDIHSNSPAAIVAPVQALEKAERIAFWEKIADRTEEREDVDEVQCSAETQEVKEPK